MQLQEATEFFNKDLTHAKHGVLNNEGELADLEWGNEWYEALV